MDGDERHRLLVRAGKLQQMIGGRQMQRAVHGTQYKDLVNLSEELRGIWRMLGVCTECGQDPCYCAPAIKDDVAGALFGGRKRG